MATKYVFPNENKIEVYVTEGLDIGIREDDDAYGNGAQTIIVSRDRLPKLIAWLQEIAGDLERGKYAENQEA